MAAKKSVKNTRNIFSKIFKRKKKTKKEQKEQSTVYVIASSVLLAGMLVSATVFYFGMRIMNSLDDIRFPYDPDKPLSIGSLTYYARQEGINTDWFQDCLNSGDYDEAIENDKNAAEELGITGTPGFYIGEYISEDKMRGFIVPGAYPYETFEKAINAVNDSGVETAFEQMTSVIRDPLYEQRYSSLLQYYESQEDVPEADAATRAEDEAKSYVDNMWQIQEVELGAYPPKKKGDPKIVIVEFTDYECPYCKRHVEETLPLIEENFVEKEIVAYYLRDIPLDEMHDNAMTSAIATRCASEKGKFWEIHDWMFGVRE